MIEGLFHIKETDSKQFTTLIIRAIAELQKQEMSVEIQYSTQIKNDIAQTMVYTALIIGRKYVAK